MTPLNRPSIVGPRTAPPFRREKPIFSKRCPKWPIEARKMGLRTVRSEAGQMVRKRTDHGCNEAVALAHDLTVQMTGLPPVRDRAFC